MINFGKRLLLLFLLLVLGSAMTGVAGALLTRVITNQANALRITAMLQDILVFIIPAVVLALLSSRLPARFLGLERPRAMFAVMALCTMVCSIPAMNALVAWNQSWQLPAALHSALRTMEDTAAEQTALMLGGDSWGSLVLSLLVVGVMAGLSEELFFRGALQRVLLSRPMGVHAAVWITAVAFSAMHMQLFGFVPRLLLGAFFGYAMVWSGSVWVPVLLHVVNNSMVVTARFLYLRGDMTTDPDSIGVGSTVIISLSVALTAMGLWRLYTLRR